MPFAAAVKFKENGASKYFHPAGHDLRADDFVWVKDAGAGGIERIGFVSSMEGRAAVQMLHLPKVLRHAEDAEIERWYELKIQEREMLETARERARAHELPMKVSDLVFVEDKRMAVIQFTSDNRIDFRELVKDLAGHFKARIEMWQIGARREAGLKDGYGVCGNPLCCGSWLKDFPSISMRYAKDQDIIQPPSKLSGPCGKLRCCLRYEHETYLELADGVATRGCTGCSSDGKCGVVVDRNLLKGELTIKTEAGAFAMVQAKEFVADSKPRRTREGAGEDLQASAARGRQEPHRWAPGEAPEDEGESVAAEDREEGEISATTAVSPPRDGQPGPGRAPGREPRDRDRRPPRPPMRDRPRIDRSGDARAGGERSGGERPRPPQSGGAEPPRTAADDRRGKPPAGEGGGMRRHRDRRGPRRRGGGPEGGGA